MTPEEKPSSAVLSREELEERLARAQGAAEVTLPGGAWREVLELALLAYEPKLCQPTTERPTTELLQSPEGQAAIERLCQKEGWATTEEGEVRKLKEAAEILFNFEKQNLQIQQEIASLREENERLLGVCIQRMESERALSDESTRLRELLSQAEAYVTGYRDLTGKVGPKEWLARLRSGKEGGKK